MFIKSITIDGFKSYGQRTDIAGFDPFFNAVTGLNGSGKSNILDSICFVLGISNLSQVRVGNLQELVYKNGQAGITKASVSVTFDNKDKTQSPVGYDHFDEITVTRQIIIGGQNKYLINGCTATNARVKDLFQSVQLNVNNPHFLIMQGRITKVINMKPIEILSMIEEAAGTKMYESKRQTSQRTIELKESKLREIDCMVTENITPTIMKLKDERAAFMEFQKIQRELEHLTKFCIAHQYISAQESNNKCKEDLAVVSTNIESLQNDVELLQKHCGELDEIIAEKVKKRLAESDEMLEDVERELKNKEIIETKITSSIKNKNECLEAEKKKLKDLNKQKMEDAKAVDGKKAVIEDLTKELEKRQQCTKEDGEALIAAEEHFKAVSAGLSNNEDGQAATLVDQLTTAKTEITRCETESKQAEMTLKHSRSELTKKEAELKLTAKEYQNDQAALGPLQKGIAGIEAEIKKLKYEEGKFEERLSQKRLLERNVLELREKGDSLSSRLPQLNFEYTDPIRNFDRSKVKGLICELFSMKDSNMATALEVVAGGKLFNAVVDNEETAKLIIAKGRMTRRRTLLPLNKIQGYAISNDVLKTAENLVGKGNVFTALSQIAFEPYLKPAMEFAFGNTLICKDADCARKVAFHPQIKKRTITIDGDIYDPSGTLAGGSKAPGDPLLIKVQEVKSIKKELNGKMKELADIEKELSTISKVAERFNELKRNLDLKQTEVELVNDRLRQTTHHQKLEEIKSLRQTNEEQEATLKRCKETLKKAHKKVAELESKIKNYENVHAQELKEAEDELNECRVKAEASLKLMKDKEQAVEILRLELDDLTSGVSNYDEQIRGVDEAVSSLQAQIDKLKESLTAAKNECDCARKAVARQKALLQERDKELNDLQLKQEDLKKEINVKSLNLKELQISISKLQGAMKDSANKMMELLRENDWIDEESKFFGQPNTSYDFKAHDPRDARKRLQKLSGKKEELSKNVNMRAMTMLDRTEEEYNALLKKKSIVENDKVTITSVIKELDEKKKKMLQSAWVKVNRDFGDIFSSLLPGTQAKLVPVNGDNVLEGLSVKVAFGDIWKESLSELSGGQKSLVALSLILALLLFNPAPIYILDEIDSALDLSHTQNIGRILKNHFKRSQFIVVSLKDGMYNNASVLFETKFVDGMSTVTRRTNSENS